MELGVSGEKVDKNPSNVGWVQGRLPEEQAGAVCPWRTNSALCLLIAFQPFAVAVLLLSSSVT